MTCEELKNKIINKTLDNSLLILSYKDNDFVIRQYINQICKDKKLIKTYIESLDEISVDANAFFEVAENVMYILKTDKFVCTEALSNYKNVIVICKEVVNKDLYPDGVVAVSQLNKDNIIEYMQVMCPGISEEKLNWLYEVSGGDIYRLDRELKKLNIFPEGTQDSVFLSLIENGGYADLTTSTIYTLVNAIINKDISTIKNVISSLDTIDIEGTGLVTILIRNIKNIIDVQTNVRAAAEDLGMSSKQFYAVRKNCGKFTISQLANIFEFLTDIDYRLKSGMLEMTNDQMVNYVIANVIGSIK